MNEIEKVEIAIISLTTNGKLYIIGEYNVIFPKGNAILYGLNKNIKFKIKESNDFLYHTRKVTQKFEYNDKTFTFESNNNDEIIKAAIKITFDYLKYKGIEPTPFNLNIVSDLESKSGEKYGFGSSSALITGVIKSILVFHEHDANNLLVFKLSVLTQNKLNDFSSGGDLASALFGGVIYYERYNKRWLLKNIESIEIVDKKWPKLKIVELKTNLKFGAIWTKTSYKTKQLTYQITKKELKQARKLVNKAYHDIITNNYLSLKKTLRKYQLWLENILEEDKLYTKELQTAIRTASKFQLTSKISGAGGGDSIIFLYPKGYNFSQLKEELTNKGLELFLI